MVDGVTATPGTQVGPGARIEVLGRRLVVIEQDQTPPRVLLYNKPEGEVVSRTDPEGRPTVFERLPRLKTARWIAVGRLDLNTQGLLVLTTSGALAERLAHPAHEVDREYLVRLRGALSAEQITRLTHGIALDDGWAHFTALEALTETPKTGHNHWYRVSIREGRQREVRRLFEASGLEVSRLKRIRFGPLTLPRALRRGWVQELEPEQVRALLDALGMPSADGRLVAIDAGRSRTLRHAARAQGRARTDPAAPRADLAPRGRRRINRA